MAQVGNMSLTNFSAAANVTKEGNSPANSNTGYIIATFFILIISLLGLVGNGLVFWFLGFRIKRTKYTVYILNLAVADLVYLICISVVMCITLILFLAPRGTITNVKTVLFGLEILLDFGNAADMFLLTAISVERCLSVFYPIWYRCNRPKLQSVLVCVFLWGLSGLVTLVDNLLCPPETFTVGSHRCTSVQSFLSVLTFLVSIPLMVTSSFILIIRIQRTSKKGQPPKLFIAIIASVVIFLISAAPVRLLWLLLYLKNLPSTFSMGTFFYASYICVSINSSANPFIYFLVGRHNMHGVREYLERALKKVFREDDEATEEERRYGVTKSSDGETSQSNMSLSSP